MRIEEFNELKEQIDDLRRRKDKAAGAKGQLLKELKQQFGCSTVQEAKKHLRKLKADKSNLQERFEKAMVAFEEVRERLKEYEDG